MQREWAIIETRKVRSNRRIALPKNVHKHVVSDILGKQVAWHYEKNSGYAIIANAKLEKPNYIFIKATDLYEDGSVRPPDDLVDRLTYEFKKGETALFLAFKEMLEGDKKTVYLISKDRVEDILSPDTDTQDFKERIANEPGFL